MKKELKKAKKSRVAIRLFSLSVATFFVATALAVTVVSAATWVGPSQPPPSGNLPGFINNTIGGGAQTASFNVTGSGTIGTDLSVSRNANVVNQLMTTELCLGSNNNPANCKTSWPASDPSSGQWAQSGGYIYNKNASVSSGSDVVNAQEVRAHSTGKLQVYGANDWLEFQVNNAQNYSEIRFGDDVGDRLRFYFWAPDLPPPQGSQAREVMTLLSNGSVGIGTASPNANLSFGTGVNDNKIYLYDAAGDKYGFGIRGAQLMIYSGASTNNSTVFGTYDGTTFGEKMRINMTGDVGIGTVAPKAKLDVNGSIALQSNTRNGNTALTSWTRNNDTEFGGASWRINEYYDPTANYPGQPVGSGAMVRTRTGPAASIGVQVNTPEGGSGGHITFSTTDSGSGGSIASPSHAPLTLRNNGQVGINTTGPNGGVWQDGVSRMEDAPLTIFDSNGGATLDLYGNGVSAPFDYTGIRLWDTSMDFSGTYKYWGIWHRSGNDNVAYKNDFRINQYIGGTHKEMFTIQSNTGNVGIGTIAPVANLDVVGASTEKIEVAVTNSMSSANSRAQICLRAGNGATDYYCTAKRSTTNTGLGGPNAILYYNAANGPQVFINNDGLEVMRLTAGGNVGIGTETPNAKLSFGTGLGDNKMYLYDGTGDKYGFGIRPGQLIIYSGATGDTVFGNYNGTNFNEKVRITTGGNVGIGISTPLSALHVPDGKYAQFGDFNAGAPPAGDCDTDAERGRLSIDTTNNRLYICNGVTPGNRRWDYITLTN